jgi:hypothetical protein
VNFLLDFLTSYYDKLVSLDNRDLDHKVNFCRKVRRLFDFLYNSVKAKEDKLTKQQKEDFRKVFLFYTHIMIKLLNDEKAKKSFYELFDTVGSGELVMNFNELFIFDV